VRGNLRNLSESGGGPVTAQALPPDAARDAARAMAARIVLYLLVVLISLFFALPMIWLALVPFSAQPSLAASLNGVTLDNFRDLVDNRYALPSLRNSLLLSAYVIALVVGCATLAAYALSRVRLPGRDLLLYLLLLLSSVVTGSAAMVPLFLLVFELGLINTYLGVTLVLAGGLLPAAIFILKDFMDSMPSSLEESARVFGASPLQVLRDVVAPMVRPGLAVIAVWTLVNVWGNFLMPFILLRSPERSPAAVVMYSFYTEGGQANLPVVAAFSLLYTIPVLVMYLFVNRRYGFRFYGGIKG
jgi:multiple sugar transport system permease protein